MRHVLSSTSLLSLFAASLIASVATAAPQQERPGRRGPGGPGGPGGGQSPQGMQMMPIIAALDVDKDGSLSAQEIENAVAQLKSLDQDGDGSLSIHEMMPRGRGGGRQGSQDGQMQRRGNQDGGPQQDGMRGMGKRGEGKAGQGKPGEGKNGQGKSSGKGAGQRDPAMMAKFFGSRDSDGDGKLSGDEIPERMRDRLERIDTNEDKAVSLEEMQSAMSKMGQRGGKKGDSKPTGTPGGERPRRPEAE